MGTPEEEAAEEGSGNEAGEAGWSQIEKRLLYHVTGLGLHCARRCGLKWCVYTYMCACVIVRFAVLAFFVLFLFF